MKTEPLLATQVVNLPSKWARLGSGRKGSDPYIDTGGLGWKNPPPTLENRGWGSEGEKEEGKKGKKRKGEREKREGRKKKRKEIEEKGKLKVFLKYSFWLGVQAR